MNSSTVRIGLLGLVALLALTGLGGGTRAAGDLFDDAYYDCPHRIRMRAGEIANLAVARDADDEDHVNVSWTTTDPATWGLGPNTYRTSLVVILDDSDGDPEAKTLSLGTKKTTFEGVNTGTKVTVEMAIVVDTAAGNYLISDIQRTSINQSLTEPSFSGNWHHMLSNSDADADVAAEFLHDSEPIANGMMYYIGYNENFANYRAGTTNPASYTHRPSTPRLRIGLAHGKETDGARDDVGFDAYIIRIEDADGDVVPQGDDVATVATNYGTMPAIDDKVVAKKLFVYGLASQPTVMDKKTDPALQNVRIVDGSKITVGMHLTLPRGANTDVTPTSLSIVKVGVSAVADGTSVIETETGSPPTMVGQVYANPPAEHRDFPIDTLSSDMTYKITAWAINKDDEVISPVTTLKVRPIDKTVTLGTGPAGLKDYRNTVTPAPAAGVFQGMVIVTEFTVLK